MKKLQHQKKRHHFDITKNSENTNYICNNKNTGNKKDKNHKAIAKVLKATKLTKTYPKK